MFVYVCMRTCVCGGVFVRVRVYILYNMYKIEKAPSRKIGFQFWRTYITLFATSHSRTLSHSFFPAPSFTPSHTTARTHIHARLYFFFNADFLARTHIHITYSHTTSQHRPYFLAHSTLAQLFYLYNVSLTSTHRRPSDEQYRIYSSYFNQKYISIYVYMCLVALRLDLNPLRPALKFQFSRETRQM